MRASSHGPGGVTVFVLALVCAACSGDSGASADADDAGSSAASDAGKLLAGRDAATAMTFAGSGGAPSEPPTDAGGAKPNADAGLHDAAGPVLEPGDPGAVDVRIDVHTDRDRHAISPLIYGSNGGHEFERNRFTALRSGGNRLTAYNWETNASNAGSDYMFQNDGLLSDSDTPGVAVTGMIEQATAGGAAAVVTIPIVDYVSADKNGGGDVRNSGSDYLQTRFKQNKAAKGSAFSSTPDANDHSVYQDEFVAFLKAKEPNATLLFSLDNEPDLWSSTHAEVHPDPVTYAELWERNQRFATAIKAAWPAAEVTGFVSYGFNGYVSLQNAADAAGRDFIEWYLDQAKAAEDTGGKRLIDYLDLHWYPEARGNNQRINEAGSDDPAVIEAREQAPRSLWDAKYEETSWIRDYLNGPIDLLHGLQKKLAAHYPGTKLAFTEWNYGGGNHISGAIAAADVLGIFGREGVGLATEWPLADDESFIEAGFRAYRNYDGHGASFGDTSVSALSADTERISVYASVDDQATDRVVLVVINKAMSALRVGVAIAHSSALSHADVYQLTGGQADFMPASAVSAVASNAFALQIPAQSISVLVAQP